MRILLAAEGESDEVVAERLLLNAFPDSEIQPKRMPARGFPVVRRLLTDIVRAAHFGHFELLVIHFDLDDTLLDTHEHVKESERWLELRKEIDDLLLSQLANTGGRTAPLQSILMTPAQSTDAWLRWGLIDGDGKKLEKKDRHALKREGFGNPPRKVLQAAAIFADRLIVQMAECQQWPRSLRDFQDALEALKEKSKPSAKEGVGP